MSNSLITMQNIAREILPLLRENLVMPETVNRDYSSDFVGKGAVIQVEKPAVFIADEFGTTINLQTITEPSVSVTMNKIADVSFSVTAREMALSIPQFRTKYLKAAAAAIAEKVNQDGLNLYKDVYNFVGASATTPDALEDFANSAKKLNDSKAPLMDRFAAWDTASTAKFQVLDAIVNAEKSGSTEALRTGAIGNINGFSNYMTQAIKTHTAGGFTSLADVTITTGAAAAKSIVLTSTAGAAITKLEAGDLFVLDGNQYVVTAQTAAAVAGVVTVAIEPALPVAFGDMAADDVTFPDVTARAHVANLAYQRDAFIFVTRPLDTPPGVESYVTMDDESGLALRVVMDYNITTKVTTMSIDFLYDYVTAYPQLATRILG